MLIKLCSIKIIYNPHFKNFALVCFKLFTKEWVVPFLHCHVEDWRGDWEGARELYTWAWVKQNDGLITCILSSLTIATKSLIDIFRQVSTLDAGVRNDYVYAGWVGIYINMYDTRMRCSHSLESLLTGFCTIHHRIKSINQHRNECSAALLPYTAIYYWSIYFT